MSFLDYAKDKVLLLMLHVCCMLLLTAFLHATGYPQGYAGLILVCWFLITIVWFFSEYVKRNRYFRRTMQILEQTDQKYLLGELMPRSFRLEDRLYQELMHRSNKAVIEKIRTVEDEKKEYKEYIESWVHEIKAPILSIFLACEKHKDERMRRILKENSRVENYVDMVLYYARSDEVYKDYLIKKTCLQQTAEEVLVKNKYYLIQNQIGAEVSCMDEVCTDAKWISFILNQLLLNAVKYKREVQPKIRIYTEKKEHGVFLVMEDNGVGIRPEDLPRIFDKGFTGSNGRKEERATGMGLYLCKKLCVKLGIQISVQSREGAGTKMILEFPVSRYLLELPPMTGSG